MEILPVASERPDQATIARAAACLRRGGLVAFPTETVYGLGAHALDIAAVARIFAAKGRPATDPLIVHVSSFEQVLPLAASVPDIARRLADRFWPGALTLVLPRTRIVPDIVTAGLDTVAVRVPAHPVALALLDAARVPVAAPSANLFSRPSPTRASHVADDLGDRVDLILDGGPTTVGVESTVIDISGPTPVVLRPGAVSLDALRLIVPGLEVHTDPGPASTSGAMPSPGLLSKHYSPRAPLTLYTGHPEAVHGRIAGDARSACAAGARVGVLATSAVASDIRRAIGELPVRIVDLGPARDASEVAARLYAGMRELDATDVDMIFAYGAPSSDGLWLAIQDRLQRAAAGRIVTV